MCGGALGGGEPQRLGRQTWKPGRAVCRGRRPCCAGVPVFVEEGDAAPQGSFSLLSAHPQTLNSLPVSYLLIPLEALAVSTRAALWGLAPFAGVSSVLQAPPLTGSLTTIRGPRNLVRVLSSGLRGCPSLCLQARLGEARPFSPLEVYALSHTQTALFLDASPHLLS